MSLEQYKEVLRQAVQSNTPVVRELALIALKEANEKRDTLDRLLIEFVLEE